MTGPNGLIAFESSRDGDTEIYVMNADGTVERNLTNSKHSFDVFPAWSPNGTQVTFSSDRAEAGSGPKWSPDCSQISFNQTLGRQSRHLPDGR